MLRKVLVADEKANWVAASEKSVVSFTANHRVPYYDEIWGNGREVLFFI
jgi:hypothetical protein